MSSTTSAQTNSPTTSLPRRSINIAAAQLGPIHLTSTRSSTLTRLLDLLHSAAASGAQLVLFPETALTTFFPRHLIPPGPSLEAFFEAADITDPTTSPHTVPRFTAAHTLKIDICIGYAERTPSGQGFNTCVYYSSHLNRLISKYRKIHLPGTVEPFPSPTAINQLEKRYFSPGDLGFTAFRAPSLISSAVTKASLPPSSPTWADGTGDLLLGMLICNDRRWPEAWRCYGLRGVELVLCGYNTAGHAPDLWGSNEAFSAEKAEEQALFQHRLVMQANSYMNSCFSVCAAKAGMEDGKFDLIGGSCIVSPEGRILAEAKGKGDEVVVAEIELGKARAGKETTFDFGRHRRTEHYGRIVEQTGVLETELL